MSGESSHGDDFGNLRRDISVRYSQGEITIDEFLSLIDEIKDVEKDGTLTVQEVRNYNFTH